MGQWPDRHEQLMRGAFLMTSGLGTDLRKLVAPERVLDSLEDRVLYAYDGTTQKSLPDAVVMVRSAQEVSAVMKYATAHKIPVIPRGAGSGLSGGSIPTEGGIAMAMVGMNHIKEIDTKNLVAVVEPGVITGQLQKAADAAGLYYPPDPSSLNYCTIGGNIAENAGGAHCIKYGVTKDYVMGLEVVLPDGDVVRLGGKQVKNVTGYNLVQFFVGSEGTLGVITEATLRLVARPQAKKTMLGIFSSLDAAAETVTGILHAGVVPSSLELMDQRSIHCVEDYLHLGLPRDAEAILLIESDGMPEAVESEAKTIAEVCQRMKVHSFQTAADAKEAAMLWQARRSISPAISKLRPSKIGEDICVPRSAVPEMIRRVQKISDKFSLPIVIFGHAGDGNLHPNILTDRRDKEEMVRVEQAIAAIFEAAVDLGGTLSGEHGVGITKKPFLSLEFTPELIKLMKNLKRAVDPQGVLNPGKIFGGE